MSHEIRTPMNAIIGMAELLDETTLNAEQSRYVEVFRRAGDNLLNLVNEILDLSKIESGQMVLETVPYSIRDVAENIGEILAPRAHDKGLDFAIQIASDIPEELIGDGNRIRQVLTNLVGNAIKFTDSGEVVMQIHADVSGGQAFLHCDVSDTGIGVASDKLEAIFDSFTQADASTTRKYGGTGLGLTISKQLVEKMGGQLTMNSIVGQGSTFSFKLPMTNDPKKSLESKLHNLFEGLHVLIVDDHAANRFILREMLQMWGAIVTEAENGEMALMQVSRSVSTYHLILLDFQMPDMNGLEVASCLQTRWGSDGPPMIMLTSDPHGSNVERARRLGVSTYLTKPVKRLDLKNAICETVKRWDVAPDPVGENVSEADSDHTPARLLVAEDSPDNQFLLRAYLKHAPYVIECVENGLDAIDAFQRRRFDLVLMDMQMPQMDGYEATRRIRQWETEHGSVHVPILALTAYSQADKLQKSLAAGCTDHLTKPIKKATLIQAIEHYLALEEKLVVDVDADLKEMIPAYLVRRQEDIDLIRRAIAQSDYTMVETLSHRMKGSGKSYGLPFVTELGSEMEVAAQKMDGQAILAAVSELQARLRKVEIRFTGSRT